MQTYQYTLLQWQQVRQVQHLSLICKTSTSQLQLLAAKPTYKVYTIPKNSGGYRTIEDPAAPLKKIQTAINQYLQYVYSNIKPKAAHGFVARLGNNEPPRNILTNATAHIGNGYMYKLDFAEYFYQVQSKHVHNILLEHCTHFNTATTQLITQLCTHHGRLPMGAPTSPCLSNYWVYSLDNELHQLCQASNIIYTRYADDLTFSSKEPITTAMQQLILDAILYHQVIINPAKTKYLTPIDVKIVTGLHVGNTNISLPQYYVDALLQEVGRLTTVLVIDRRYNTGMSKAKLHTFIQEIQGKIQFAKMVLDASNPQLSIILEKEKTIYQPEIVEQSISWLDIPYNLF